MEFAGKVDFEQEIVTWRPSAKWAGRVRPGNLIEVERVHQRKPGRFLARVLAMDETPPPLAELNRLALIYPHLTPKDLIRIVLRVEPRASREDRAFVTWETKTTRILRRR